MQMWKAIERYIPSYKWIYKIKYEAMNAKEHVQNAIKNKQDMLLYVDLYTLNCALGYFIIFYNVLQS